MKRLSLVGIVLAVGFSVVDGAWAINFTFDTDWVDLDDANNATWYTDRYKPGVFESGVVFDGDERLQHGIREADSQANRPAAYSSSFYNTQGAKYDTNLTSPIQRLCIDLYVGSDWGSNDRYAGLWATGFDSVPSISAYPILQFRSFSDVDAGFYYYDYIAGAWIEAMLLTDPTDFGKWYTLSFDLTVGTGVEYFIDGTSVGTFADSDTVSLGNAILNAGNYGEDYDVYWDNFCAEEVPEPTTMALLTAGIAAMAGRRRGII